MVSKQEEIEKRLLSKVKSIRAWRNYPDIDPLSAEDDTKDILDFLHSKGVVIKGESHSYLSAYFTVEPLVLSDLSRAESKEVEGLN